MTSITYCVHILCSTTVTYTLRIHVLIVIAQVWPLNVEKAEPSQTWVMVPLWVLVSGCSGRKASGWLLPGLPLFWSKLNSPSGAGERKQRKDMKTLFWINSLLTWSGQTVSTHPVVPEGTRLRVGGSRSFGALGGLQVEVVVEVLLGESVLQEEGVSVHYVLDRSSKSVNLLFNLQGCFSYVKPKIYIVALD